jgi:hypothetical protein
MGVFTFKDIARNDGDTAPKGVSVKKQLIKTVTVKVEFLKFERRELRIVCFRILHLLNI